MLQFRGSVITSDAGLLVRPDVSENSQISPSISVRTTRSAGGRPTLASVLQGGENGANIHV